MEEEARAILRSVLLRDTGPEMGLGTQIAGIVIHHKATLATRNVKDFDDLDIPLVNPWTA